MTAIASPRIVVLGVTGMLGHKMFQTLSAQFPDVYGTMRGRRDDARWSEYPFLQSERIFDQMDALDLDAFTGKVRELRPEIVINCVGAIKQRASAENGVVSITLNALLPQRLANDLKGWEGRLIHFSTDCVFSGQKGNYDESDPSDATDLYGKSKHLGELLAGNSLVLRTSIIGRELSHHASLLDWFLLGNHKSVHGFTRAWWSGVTTNHLSTMVGEIIAKFGYLKGLYQVSSGKISKYDLLLLLKEAYGMSVDVVPDDSFFCDRSMSGDLLKAETGYQSPQWTAMLQELVQDPTPYKPTTCE
ncbi:MAG: SDR family oxidoreductase [Gemmatimonadaceae bacterium]|nr:SDR family oxidoreductase [Gemmatimonadaceae bacterium]MBA3656832.1 SDR family oxidoreductase [Gemmatimonadaceae bacterium]